jgi:hypothetical protein
MVKKVIFQEKKIKENIYVRKFSNNLNESELKWHIDLEDRLLFPLHETDWKIQVDNKLPQKIVFNKSIFIESKIWHRLIKGNGDLYLLIIKREKDV